MYKFGTHYMLKHSNTSLAQKACFKIMWNKFLIENIVVFMGINKEYYIPIKMTFFN